MIELAIAYDKKDLKRVKEILSDLQKGILNPTIGNAISDKLKLKEIAKRLRTKIKDLEIEIINIKESEQYQTIIEIEDWEKYFEDLKIILGDELEMLEKEAQQDE